MAARDGRRRDPAEVGDLVVAARTGDRRSLGRLLSLAELAAADPGADVAATLAAALAEARPPVAPARRPRVLGLTGPPGAGKSTLAGVLAATWQERGRTVWVLAVDPTSPVTGGALLGDRVRMSGAGASGVVVRSLASRGAAGGVAAALPWALRVAAAVGADDVVVETVGSGQADTAVTALADVTVLAVAPGLGDEVQAMKAGIAELAHVVCVTKGDRPDAAQTARQWRSALGGRASDVVVASAATGDVDDLVQRVDDLVPPGPRTSTAVPATGESSAAVGRPGGGPADDGPARVDATVDELPGTLPGTLPDTVPGTLPERLPETLAAALDAADAAATDGRPAATLVHLASALTAAAGPGSGPDHLLALDDLEGLHLAEASGLRQLVAVVRARTSGAAATDAPAPSPASPGQPGSSPSSARAVP